MKAANLTVTIPYAGCDKNCPYCVSQITGHVESNLELMKRNLVKVKTLCQAAGVTTVLLTSKGEPMLNIEDLLFFMRAFSDWPLELQTNGKRLIKNLEALKIFAIEGLNTIAVSIDNEEDMINYPLIFIEAQKFGLTTRATINITTAFNDWDIKRFVHWAQANNVDQVLLRNITVPNGAPVSEVTCWIRRNTNQEHWDYLQNELKIIGIQPVATTTFGYKIYDIHGVGFVANDYCIQDAHNFEDIRSLIFQEDGHVYTSWMAAGSRLF